MVNFLRNLPIDDSFVIGEMVEEDVFHTPIVQSAFSYSPKEVTVFIDAAEYRLIYICFFSPIYMCEVSQTFMVVEILHTINLIVENSLYVFNVVYVYHSLWGFLNISLSINSSHIFRTVSL